MSEDKSSNTIIDEFFFEYIIWNLYFKHFKIIDFRKSCDMELGKIVKILYIRIFSNI